MSVRTFPVAGVLVALLIVGTSTAAAQETSPGAGPIVVVETQKGTFEFETYPNEAPKTVARIRRAGREALLQRAARASRGRGLRRADGRPADAGHDEEGPVGDGRERPVDRRGRDLQDASPTSVGMVSMAHAGDPAKRRQPVLHRDRRRPATSTGKHQIWGRVISGMDVVNKTAVGDRIIRATVKGGK
jgi:cyclophilin family peptidyl-prolyl cis-trans isomerase